MISLSSTTWGSPAVHLPASRDLLASGPDAETSGERRRARPAMVVRRSADDAPDAAPGRPSGSLDIYL